MMSHLFMIMLMLWGAVAWGDGLPIVDGKVDAPHTMLTLSESQAEEIEVLGTLTLTDKQWQDLKKIGPAAAKRYDTILPATLRDCTCGYGEYVILMSRHKAAVLHGFLKPDRMSDLKSLFTVTRSDVLGGSRWDKYFGQFLRLNVNSKGRFYLGGTEIPYDQLRELLSLPQRAPFGQDQTKPVENQRIIAFELAPGVEASAAILEKGRELKRIAEATGWTVEIGPYPWEADVEQ